MPPHVTLRVFTADDLPALAEYWRNVDPATDMDGMGYASPQDDQARFDTDGFLSADRGRLAVVADDAFAGFVGWTKRQNSGNPYGYSWNIGIGLLQQHRGRGVGTRAQQLLVDHLFATTPVQRIEAGTDAENDAEQRALTTLGFTKDGVIRSGNFAEGRWRDMLLYSILRPEHEQRERQRRDGETSR